MPAKTFITRLSLFKHLGVFALATAGGACQSEAAIVVGPSDFDPGDTAPPGTHGVAVGIVVVPPGLNPGDTYRLAFVTSGNSLGTSVNIADYNSVVSTAANSVPELNALGASWNVIGSTSTTSAFDNVAIANPGIPIYRLDGLLIATGTGTNVGGLFSGSIANAVNISELGTPPSAGFVRTGSTSSGASFPGLEFGSVVGNVLGSPNAVNALWLDSATGLSTLPFALYGISSEITVAAVPEPKSTAAFLGVSSLLFALWRKRAGFVSK